MLVGIELGATLLDIDKGPGTPALAAVAGSTHVCATSNATAPPARAGEASFTADTDKVDRSVWLDRAQGDRHQFRIIVSPEDGADYDDLKPLTRRLMTRMEEDLGTRLDWVAVDHFNTGHPHTHIIVRGRDERGHDLIIARDYLSHGLRERACELVDLDLGPRSDEAIEQRLRAEVGQERLTSIDRALIREADANVLVSTEARGAFDHAIRMGRLKRLDRLGLATQMGSSHWRLVPDLADTLRRCLIAFDETGVTFRYKDWTCNGFAPVTFLIMPPWLRRRAG